MVRVTFKLHWKSREMAGHTGQSSQLFPVTNARNAQFLATLARSGLVREVEIYLTVQKQPG